MGWFLTSILLTYTGLTFAFITIPQFPTFSPKLHQPTSLLSRDELTASEEKLLFGGEDQQNDFDLLIRGGEQQTLSQLGVRRVAVPSTAPQHSFSPNPLDISSDKLTNDLMLMRSTLTNCPMMWGEIGKLDPSLPALYDRNHCGKGVVIDWNFKQVAGVVSNVAQELRDEFGVERGDHVSLFAENSAYWIVCDHGIQSLGGASAVRGADAPLEELRYIYSHSDSKMAILQGPTLFEKMAKSAPSDGPPLGLESDLHGPVKSILLMQNEKMTDEEISDMVARYYPANPPKVTVLPSLLASPPPSAPSVDLSLVAKEDLATIVYTSGTTGRPKGVCLTHANLLHQLNHRLAPSRAFDDSEPLPRDVMLSLLPVWHITERTFELWQLSRGCNVVYSSIRTFKKDLEVHRPHWMVLVPRVLEKVANGVQAKFSEGSSVKRSIVNIATFANSAKAESERVLRGLVNSREKPSLVTKIVALVTSLAVSPLSSIGNKLVYSKVQAGFGGRQKLIISGGSALSGKLEKFYSTAGVDISVGYGLTETSPLIAFRRSDANLKTGGCVGKPCYDTHFRIIHEDSGEEVREGEVGVVTVRGPQVMRGYYKNQEATDAAIDRNGFFNTGDLGRINLSTGDLILTGRSKDTIVLNNGENIEPLPIEDAIANIDLIDQVMLVGDERKACTAVCVLNLAVMAEKGLMATGESERLNALVEIMNDPKFDGTKIASAQKELIAVGEKIRLEGKIGKVVNDSLKQCTGVEGGFRKWEKVAESYLLVEPFAMSNSLLTQSFKIKRNSIAERYGGEF